MMSSLWNRLGAPCVDDDDDGDDDDDDVLERLRRGPGTAGPSPAHTHTCITSLTPGAVGAPVLASVVVGVLGAVWLLQLLLLRNLTTAHFQL